MLTKHSASPGQCNVKLLQNKDLTLLGAPILPEAIITVLESLMLMSDRLIQIDAHEALFLLWNCFSIPKVTYFLNMAPCFFKRGILQAYDNLIWVSLQKILNIQLEETSWNQCTLPINLRLEIGLRSCPTCLLVVCLCLVLYFDSFSLVTRSPVLFLWR